MSIDHAELQASARQVISGLGVRADDEKTWPLMVDLGWLLVGVPEELGGLGQGLAASCVIYTELGRGIAGARYLPSMLALDAVCQGEFPDRQAWVERISDGAFVTAALGASAVSLAGLNLNGVLRGVHAADKASHVLVCAEDCVALAPLEQGGVERVQRPTWDESRRLFDVSFANAKLDEALVIARGPAARTLSARIAMHRDCALAADSVGGANALLEMTVDYLKTRRQFGRPLALFQALKHRCADLKTQTSGAEALLVDALSRDADAFAGKMAKHLACANYARVGEEAIQLHGGIAMTAEHTCHFYVKRALLNEHLGERGDTYAREIGARFLDAR